MGRNREIIEARTQHWMDVAEEYAKAKFEGKNPEQISIALNLFNESPYPYYMIVGGIGDRAGIHAQIDSDIEDFSKCLHIISKLAAMCATNNWTPDDLGDAVKFLFSGNNFVESIFEGELNAAKSDENIFLERVDFIQYAGQYLEDLPEDSVKLGEQDE